MVFFLREKQTYKNASLKVKCVISLPSIENAELMIAFQCRSVYTSQGNQPTIGLLKFSVLYMDWRKKKSASCEHTVTSHQYAVKVFMPCVDLTLRLRTLSSDLS